MNSLQAMPPLILHPPPLSNEQFYQLCQENPQWTMERSATGDILVMAPIGAETGERNFDLLGQLWFWAKRDGRGRGFDSSTGFTLPNGAVRSPDAAWVLKARWEALSPEERRGFAPLCPDFVLELRSATACLTTLQAKMEEYLANGTQLGWLLDPVERRAHIYRPDQGVAILAAPLTLSGEPVLPGLIMDLGDLWA